MTQDNATPPGTGDNTAHGPDGTSPDRTTDRDHQTGPRTGSDGGPDGSGPDRGTVVPFRRPDPASDPHTIDGEVLEPGTDMAVGTVRHTWGTRVVRSTGRVLAGPSDETRARLAEATVEFSHTAGHRIGTGTRTGLRVTGRGWHFARRHASIIGKGIESARQRKRADRENTDLKAARAEARASGDHSAVEALTRQYNEGRHVTVDTMRKWADLVWGIGWRTGAALGVLFVVSVIVGLVNGLGRWLGEFDATDVLAVWRGALAFAWAAGVFVVTWWWTFPTGAALLKLSRWWRDGNRLGDQVLPVHLRKEATRNLRVELSESAVVAALANINNGKLNAVIKEGWPHRDTDNAWVQPPMIDGKGWSTKIRLPQGAPVKAIDKAKEMLSHNLGCRPMELFVRADTEDPTVLDLFRLNPGALRDPVDPYPLLSEGATDYWSGFPVGVNLRGEPIVADMPERNFVMAGAPGSGKSTLMITLATGAILDPLVDVDVFVFAENNDYEALKPCLNEYSPGAGEDNVNAALDHLQGLYDDLTERGRLLQKHNVSSVLEAGREIVAREPGLRPRIVVLEECQRLFRQDKAEDRKRIVNLVINLFMASRKYAVHLAFLTPSPSDQSLPRDLVAMSTNRACGAVNGNKARNNAVLGEKAHEEGISALDLKPKTKTALNDCGTLVTVGFMDEPGALRSYFLSEAAKDAIVARALEARGGGAGTVDIVVARDPLTDVLAVLAEMTPREGETHPRAAAVAAALAARWNHYSGWQIKQVTDLLGLHGYKVPTTDRQYPVDPARVADALSARDTVGAE
ncbi:FtsK/SpoIIIE domain-containing protein [Amycolatopsis sp. NBC_01307]|uniref:FtsK/SpoIIIE domain-containing protein n=1 Tax=Amycolatopsis sp. NBC_01307 TaxID=2903561 RepID=UPI002E12BEE4|nr:FtsK/SpoIIIE domain-containing protein [Amycolatopsis sp. NBC_01307]